MASRVERVPVYVNKEEKQRLRMRAAAAGVSMSEWARELLLSGTGLGVTAELSAEIERCHAEIAALCAQLDSAKDASAIMHNA